MFSFDRLFDFKKKEDFFMLLGPSFLFVTLFLTSFVDIPNKDIFLATLVGIWFCWRKSKEGLIISVVFLFILSFMKHFQISNNHIFQLGIEVSLGMGFLISYLSFEEFREKNKLGDEAKKKYLDVIGKLKLRLEKEADFYRRQEKNLKYEIDKMRDSLEEKVEDVELKDKIAFLEAKLKEGEKSEESRQVVNQEIDSGVAKELEKVRKELEDVKQEKEKSYVTNQSLSRVLAKEVSLKKELEDKILELQNKEDQVSLDKIELLKKEILEKNKIINNYQEGILKKNEVESMYKQLRKQFEDKKRVLEDARKKLFVANERLEVIDIKKNDESIDNEEIKELVHELGIFKRYFKNLEGENKGLEDIVTVLTDKGSKV